MGLHKRKFSFVLLVAVFAAALCGIYWAAGNRGALQEPVQSSVNTSSPEKIVSSQSAELPERSVAGAAREKIPEKTVEVKDPGDSATLEDLLAKLRDLDAKLSDFEFYQAAAPVLEEMSSFISQADGDFRNTVRRSFETLVVSPQETARFRASIAVCLGACFGADSRPVLLDLLARAETEHPLPWGALVGLGLSGTAPGGLGMSSWEYFNSQHFQPYFFDFSLQGTLEDPQILALLHRIAEDAPTERPAPDDDFMSSDSKSSRKMATRRLALLMAGNSIQERPEIKKWISSFMAETRLSYLCLYSPALFLFEKISDSDLDQVLWSIASAPANEYLELIKKTDVLLSLGQKNPSERSARAILRALETDPLGSLDRGRLYLALGRVLQQLSPEEKERYLEEFFHSILTLTLKEEDESSRGAGVGALSMVKELQPLSLLEEFLQTDPHPRVRAFAAGLIAEMKDKPLEVIALLEKRYHVETEKSVKRAILKGLKKMNHPEVALVFDKLAQTEQDPELRQLLGERP